MKKILLLFILAMCVASQASAQMSDEQVTEYVKERYQAGVDQQSIATELFKKGVSREQLMRIKSKYDSSMELPEVGKQASPSAGNNLRKPVEDPNEFVMLADMGDKGDASRIFGHELFSSKSLTFEPNINIPTPASYTLGPGDELMIDIYGTSQSSKKYNVSPEGTIVIEKIGPIAVSGLTVEQAQQKICSKIGVHYQGSSIKVAVGQTRTVIVNVLGEVKNPGTYKLSAFSTVFNALYLAGGITDIGTLRNIKVTRNGRTISTIDVYDYIMNGKLSGNVVLKDNDAIIVGAYDALVNVKGAIKRPMFYEMKTGESLQALIAYAGGLAGDANKSVIRVERKTSDGYTVHSVNEWDFTTFGMQDGDYVAIDNVVKRYKNRVDVSGAVFYPGQYSLTGECSSVRQLISKAGGLTETAFGNRAVLYRMLQNRTRETMPIDLKNILDGATADVILQNEDSLVIISTEKELARKKYYIYGPVVNAGEFQFTEGTTLEDAIVAAGGLEEEALLSCVEISRRLQYTDQRDSTYSTKTELYTFDIENGLIVNDGKSFVIKPYDVITIKRNPDYAVTEMVYIGGEVKYPGIYALKTKTDRISDLIQRAGGVTSGGYFEGANLTRKMSKEEKERAEQLWEMAHARDSIDTDKIMIKDRYPVGIDLVKALKKPGCSEDVVMRGDDNLIIPKINNTVKINGEVLYPNTITYIQGKPASYYINQAGGISTNGQKRKAYIIYANGQVSRVSKGKVMPGSEIVVPTKQKRVEDKQKTSFYLAASSVIATIGAVLLSALR